MNLHGVASACITTINPNTPATLRKSNGQVVVGTDGHRTMGYDDITGMLQVQSLSNPELRFVNSLNLGGVSQKVYMDGRWDSIVRSQVKGGDIFIFPQAKGEPDRVWLVVQQMESWPGWCSVLVTLQEDEAAS